MGDIAYAESREFGDSFMPEVKSILGQVLLVETSDFEDMRHNADLTIRLNCRNSLEIAVRIRHHKYLTPDYMNQFTLCCHRNSGNDAEWQKIIGQRKKGDEIESLGETWGDYLFYGFEDRTGTYIERWFVGQFDQFRVCVPHLKLLASDHRKIILDDDATKTPIGEVLKVSRTDEFTHEKYWDYFYAFDRDAFPGFVIADSDNWPEPKLKIV